MTDKVRAAFLTRQFEDGMALAAASDLLTLAPVEPTLPPQRYLAEFRCKGLVQSDAGEIVEADHFLVGIWFPDDYLRAADPFRVLTWIEPQRAWHPNVRAPFICAGRLTPGTPLVDLIFQCSEIITFTKVTMREDDALNKDACAWARGNQHRFPIDRRPLKRRSAEFAVEAVR